MKKKTVYKGKPVSVDVYNLTVEGRKVRREIIQHPGAAAILAFDENGKVILVKQHRFPHGYILEIPAGTLEKREKPVNCAYPVSYTHLRAHETRHDQNWKNN